MNRNERIQSIIARLEAIKASPEYASREYAIDENIRFMRAIRNPIAYVWWLATRVPRLNGSQLLELTDFPVEAWDVNMHTRLIEMQRNPNIGLIEPLVSRVVELVQAADRDVILCNLGAGGMETDRQILARLMASNHTYRVTIVSVDNSAVTRSIARTNLSTLGDALAIQEVGSADADRISTCIKNIPQRFAALFSSSDIFTLADKVSPGYFDVLYHSLFLHHLTDAQRSRLETIELRIAKRRIEFDGFWCIPVLLPQTIVGWNYPEFFNAEVFSNLRFRPKRQIQEYASTRGAVTFSSKSGFYLLDHASST